MTFGAGVFEGVASEAASDVDRGKVPMRAAQRPRKCDQRDMAARQFVVTACASVGRVTSGTRFSIETGHPTVCPLLELGRQVRFRFHCRVTTAAAVLARIARTGMTEYTLLFGVPGLRLMLLAKFRGVDKGF